MKVKETMSQPNQNGTDPPQPKPGLVKIAAYSRYEDAELDAAELRAGGFAPNVFGANYSALNPLHKGWHDVELFVPEAQAEKALDFLKKTAAKTPDPPEDTEESQGDVDDKGQPLVEVGEFDDVRELRGAETLLASAGIVAFLARRDGQTQQFVVRVADEDVDTALELLADEASEDADEPQCPKCGSWRIHEVTNFLAEIASAFGGKRNVKSMECLSCNYRALVEEFSPEKRADR
jgi:hypothetical protein